MTTAEVSTPVPTAALANFAGDLRQQTPLRAAITAAYRRPEEECLPALLEAATLSDLQDTKINALTRRLVVAIRDKRRASGVEALLQEFSLSSEEGVALMCLAEALLRIPDSATRDALIRDKLSGGEWRAHLGHSPSLFVNAATWGLVVAGQLGAANGAQGLGTALNRLIARAGEPVIRRGMDLAVRMMGEQFVLGQTISQALSRARAMEAKGFRYSYDMLGEAAMSAGDAACYLARYEDAIHSIGHAAAGRGIVEGPGISIKLSALHPRYAPTQRERVMAELLPCLAHLAVLARRYDIGINIDAEEADRLELSLDLLEALCKDERLRGWNGVGFVIQAYQRRAPFVVDFVADLARRTQRRIMVRLVKGAYWDSEIKRAQVDGLEGFPVFTRKIHTDVSYVACARRLLASRDAVFPQFATHNARTLATIYEMAGPERYEAGQYEFQCLHGMGEPLYEEVVEKLDRPCRIYAPVGTHETLLAYLVRRLLENGANSSFVHRINDSSVSVEELAANPAAAAMRLSPPGRSHDSILQPRAILGPRVNSAGLDLSNDDRLADIAEAFQKSSVQLRATPMVGEGAWDGAARPVLNPADENDRVGEVVEASSSTVQEALAAAQSAAQAWAHVPPAERAVLLERASDLMESRMLALLSPIIREAGKSIPNAVGEIREAVDFLRYYAAQARGFDAETHRPLGPVLCISPWNFPLAIFTGQAAAALAAGNAVIAKPAEEVPLIASLAVRLLHEAGVPASALQLLPGGGDIGAALVRDPRVQGVMFTGSTDVARAIQQQLAQRLGHHGRPVPFIAETGGQNALIVDSSALPEQVVADVVASAFDSAGQRCSALRVLCIQDDIADPILAMLKGAMAELTIGNPARLSTDVGPVITEQACLELYAYIDGMRAAGRSVHAVPLPKECARGHFVAPTLTEISSIAELQREVFGPVLHVLRWRHETLDALLRDLHATGYALTFGVHSRIDEAIERLVERAPAGNVYVNRNLIGAVVGVQPFGGHGLSGTGPKAGGPLYMRRLLAASPAKHGLPPETMLPGPVGEENRYVLRPRGTVLCIPATRAGMEAQVDAALAAGNKVRLVWHERGIRAGVSMIPAPDLRGCDAVLFEGEDTALLELQQQAAAMPGPILPVLRYPADGQNTDMLWLECSISTNTAAVGGNASLLALTSSD
jgi:RHH-type transcriptional regulator, proline utilization regulon repressor / proline dehydrogenase / delta 1-pyrroline-5-carboxylate dehydrogenase